MVDDDKLFDEDELEEPAVIDDEDDEDDLDMLGEDDDDMEDEDDLDPKHLGSLGFGIEEEEL
jgi:hypothetical protein